MKSAFALCSCSLLLASPVSHGTVISVTNFSGDPSTVLPVFDFLGWSPHAAGSYEVLVGNYGGGAPPNPRLSPLSGFQQFGTTQLGSFTALGNPGGFFNLTFQVPTPAATNFIGEEIYVLVMNPFDWGAAVIWKGPEVVDDVVGIEGQTSVLIEAGGTGSLIAGKYFDPPPTDYGGPLGTWDFDNALMADIPEPCSALLSGIGALACLRRRRGA